MQHALAQRIFTLVDALTIVPKGVSRTNIVFDAYGTLWNVTSIRSACEAVVGSEHAAPFLDLWRQKQLEYAFLRTVMDRYKPFSRVTADALAFATATFGLSLDQQTQRITWFTPGFALSPIQMRR